jgi:hypothetical protein
MTGLDLKLERVRLGLRQWRVAAALSIHPTALWLIESDRRPVSPERARQIWDELQRLASGSEA